MIKLDKEFFTEMQFEESQIRQYFLSAENNIRIAESVKIPEVIFKFSYDGLIKLGITLIASNGYKIKSKIGHHIKILETMAKILDDSDIEVMGNAMRIKRNFDLYDTGAIISKKECEEYLEFVLKTLKKTNAYLNEKTL